MIDALVTAFELANVDVMALKLPEAVVKEVSTALLAKWNCQRSDIIGKPLMKFGSAVLSARHLPPDPRQPQQSIIEVNYAPPLGSHIKSVFRTQIIGEGEQTQMLLIGQQSSAEHLESAINNERRLNLALRSGGYALWDHDYETGDT